MKEVLQCVAALPDDEHAYINYHKSEASKRLVESKIKQKEVLMPVNVAKKPVKRTSAKIKSASLVEEAKDSLDVKIIPTEPIMAEPFDNGFCRPERCEVSPCGITSNMSDTITGTAISRIS